MLLHFSKYHALGNDFVLMEQTEDTPPLTPDDALRWCDRHRGVGADGVLLLRQQERACHVTIINSDGSYSDMCGNGLRCVAAFLENGGAMGPWTFTTGSGEYAASSDRKGAYTISLGKVSFTHPALPTTTDGHASLTAGGRTFEVIPAWIGNPHGVILTEEPPLPLAERYGPELSTHPAFPDGANITFLNASDASPTAVVHERGVGITQACGSATACSVAALVTTDRHGNDWKTINLPGGPLDARYDSTDGAFLRGDAHHVFDGVWCGT